MTTQRKKLRLMYEAVDRYLELCREGRGGGVCECDDHASDCPFDQRPCLAQSGGLCHWCQLEAARQGQNWETIEANHLSVAAP